MQFQQLKQLSAQAGAAQSSLPSAQSSLSGQRRAQIQQQADAIYQQNSKALYPLASSIGGGASHQSGIAALQRNAAPQASYQLNYMAMPIQGAYQRRFAFGRDLQLQQQQAQ